MTQKNQLNEDLTKKNNQKNEAYFKSFVRTRGGVHVLQVSFAFFFIALVCLSITWRNSPYEYNMNPWKSKINLVLVGICMVLTITFLLVLSQRVMQVLVKHQGFIGIWECCVSVIYTFTLMFAAYLVSQLKKGSGIQYGSLFSLIVITLFFSVYAGSLIYNWFWLKRQLYSGFSEQRTLANYFPRAKAVYKSNVLIIIFVVVSIISIFTGYFYQLFGIFGGLLFAAAFSRLTIEIGYSAYLLNKSKDYWITYHFEEKPPWQKRLKARFKKMSTYVVLWIIMFFLMFKIDEKFDVPEKVMMLFAYVILGTLICLGIAFLIWIVRSIKRKRIEKNNERKNKKRKKNRKALLQKNKQKKK